jgi:hypothetical protein
MLTVADGPCGTFAFVLDGVGRIHLARDTYASAFLMTCAFVPSRVRA